VESQYIRDVLQSWRQLDSTMPGASSMAGEVYS
jgi:hypothetical protein